MKRLPSGETLIEVIIAVSVLMVVMSPLSVVFVSSIRNSAGHIDTLQAELLADSGIELLYNARNTNLLRFSSKTDDCWNASPLDIVTINNCDLPENKIQAGTYTIDENPADMAIRLDKQITAFDPADPQETYRLKLNNYPPVYNHTNGSSTNFFREIGITYSSDSEVMGVASNVYFRNGTKLIKIPRSIFLTKQP